MAKHLPVLPSGLRIVNDRGGMRDLFLLSNWLTNKHVPYRTLGMQPSEHAGGYAANASHV